jgi:hypothetical protein
VTKRGSLNVYRFGLDETAITAAATGSTQGLPQEEAAILAWTDRLLVHHTLSDAEREEALKLRPSSHPLENR